MYDCTFCGEFMVPASNLLCAAVLPSCSLDTVQTQYGENAFKKRLFYDINSAAASTNINRATVMKTNTVFFFCMSDS